MNKRPVTPPNYSATFSSPGTSPRGVRASLWMGIFFMGVLLGDGLASSFEGSRPLLDPIWSELALRVGLFVVSVLGGITMWRTGVRGPLPFMATLGASAWLFLPTIGVLPLKSSPPTTADSGLLAKEPVRSSGSDWSNLGVTDWDDDVVAWSVALQTQPLDAVRSARTKALTAALIEAFEQQEFVPYGTLTAVVDAGALTSDAAIAMLVNPRRREKGEAKPDPLAAARSWLIDLAHEDPGSGLNYATARAVLLLFPELEGLRPALEAALRSNLPPPGAEDAVASLRNGLVIADIAGLTEIAAVLRDRIASTLLGAWIDDTGYLGREAGWTTRPEESFGLTDAYETHLALELLQRGGIPAGIDLNHVRMTMTRHSVERWYDPAEHVLAAIDAELLDRTWPAELKPRFRLSDGAFVGLIGLIAWAVFDILRQPLPPSVG